VKAVWHPVLQKAQIKEARGKYLDLMGTHSDGAFYLNADEALWLVDRGRMELTFGGIPVSVQQMFHFFSILSCSFSISDLNSTT
jgi:hypothetical protein